jgi:hypothetical protein
MVPVNHNNMRIPTDLKKTYWVIVEGVKCLYDFHKLMEGRSIFGIVIPELITANRTCRTLASEYTCCEDMLRIVAYNTCKKGVGMVDNSSVQCYECPINPCSLNREDTVTLKTLSMFGHILACEV